MANIQSGASTDLLSIDTTSKAAHTTIYDVSGSIITVARNYIAPTSQNYMPIAGIDQGIIVRPIRVGSFGTQRTTSEILLFNDCFEGNAINGNQVNPQYISGSTTMTTTQALSGVLAVNDNQTTAANSYYTLTTVKQHPKYARQPLFTRMRCAMLSVTTIHTFTEFGFGAPINNVAIVSNGAFFRLKTDGTLAGIFSFNGTEKEAVFTVVPVAGRYYYYDIILDDDSVRFIVADANEAPIIDQAIQLNLTVPNTFAVSHTPTFFRVYTDGTGGGTAQTLYVSAHMVQLLDGINNIPWADQKAGLGRHSLNHPVSGVLNNSWRSTSQLSPGVAPASFTPSATAGGNAFLGGEALCAATATSENLLSVFSYGIPTPYSLFITDVNVNVPINTGAVVGTTDTILEFALVLNCSSSNIQSGGGQRILIPNALYKTTLGTAINGLFTGSMVPWAPRTPLMCMPGTYVHLAYKVIVGTATGSEIYRLGATIGGYYQ